VRGSVSNDRPANCSLTLRVGLKGAGPYIKKKNLLPQLWRIMHTIMQYYCDSGYMKLSGKGALYNGLDKCYSTAIKRKRGQTGERLPRNDLKSQAIRPVVGWLIVTNRLVVCGVLVFKNNSSFIIYILFLMNNAFLILFLIMNNVSFIIFMNNVFCDCLVEWKMFIYIWLWTMCCWLNIEKFLFCVYQTAYSLIPIR
jgi:hypothetical protein